MLQINQTKVSILQLLRIRCKYKFYIYRSRLEKHNNKIVPEKSLLPIESGLLYIFMWFVKDKEIYGTIATYFKLCVEMFSISITLI